jgi:hypothetical protein
MGTYAALYVVAACTAYGRWIRRFWRKASPKGDPLYQLLHPDQRGECEAWGTWPHWTVLDALTVVDPTAFARIVKAMCRLCPAPTLVPEKMNIFAGTSLVVQCSCEPLGRLLGALAAATRHLIERAPLTDEEFQRAEWWIRRVGRDVQRNCKALHLLWKDYVAAGAPPLPASRHFRLSFLMRLWNDRAQANTADRAQRAQRHWDYFLAYGEPYWYANPALHTTIASGLIIPSGTTVARRLEVFRQTIWPVVQQKLRCYQPRYLAIMGENPRREIDVTFQDRLTQVYVPERRPGFRVVDKAHFA